MDSVNEVMKALKQVALKGKKDKGLAERVDSLTATLRLLVFSPKSDRLKRTLYRLLRAGYFSNHRFTNIRKARSGG